MRLASLPYGLCVPPTAFTPEPVRRRVAGMKQILLMMVVLCMSGCGKKFPDRADVIGAYELSEGSKTLRLEFKADGIVHSYMNGIFADARLATWALNEGEVRMINQYGQCLVYRVEPDGSLTAIRKEFVKPNGEKWSKDFPASEQKNLLKVSDHRREARRAEESKQIQSRPQPASGEPEECEHIWSKWESFSRNPERKPSGGLTPWAVKDWRRRFPDQTKGRSDDEIAATILQSKPKYAILYPELVRFRERERARALPKHIPTTGGRPVAYQERRCSTCGKLDRN